MRRRYPSPPTQPPSPSQPRCGRARRAHPRGAVAGFTIWCRRQLSDRTGTRSTCASRRARRRPTLSLIHI
eukprot:6987123-Prymnesium_polylepis.1